MWTCSNCDTKNEEKDQFCSCCGEKRIVVKSAEKNQKKAETINNNRQQYSQSTNRTSTEQFSGYSSSQSAGTVGTQTKMESRDSTERSAQKRNARILALVISIALILLEYWDFTAFEGTRFDFTNKSSLLVMAAPFVCTAFVFYGKSIPLMTISGVVLGFFSLYEVFLFVFCINGGSLGTAGMWICIIVGVVVALKTGKTIVQGVDDKNT